MVVVVDVPLTRQFLAHHLSLYKVKTFEQNSPDNQTYHTKLSTAPAYIAYDYKNPFYFVSEKETDLPFPAPIKPWQIVSIHEPDVQLFSVRKLSCGMALVGGSFDTSKHTCGYNIVFEELPPNVYRLSETKLLLNNVQELRVTRRGRDSIRALNETILIEAPHYIYEIPCESQVEVLGHVIFSYTECQNSVLVEYVYRVRYPLNLMVLRKFFSNHSMLQDINSDLELNSSLDVQLGVEKAEFSRILASEESYAFDLDKALNASLANEQFFSSVSHYVWQQLGDLQATVGDFSFWSWRDYSIVALIIITFIDTLILIMAVYKIKALSLFMLPLKRGMADFVFTTVGQGKTTVVENHQASAIWKDIQTAVSELWSVELLLIFIFTLLLMQICMKLWEKRFRDIKHHTIFKLDLTAGTKKFSKIIWKLDFPPNFYRIEVTPNAFYLVHQNFLTTFNWKAAVVITEKLTSTTVRWLLSPSSMGGRQSGSNHGVKLLHSDYLGLGSQISYS